MGNNKTLYLYKTSIVNPKACALNVIIITILTFYPEKYPIMEHQSQQRLRHSDRLRKTANYATGLQAILI